MLTPKAGAASFIGVLCLIGGAYHFTRLPSAPPAPAALHGTLVPPVTVRIDAAVESLDVPIDSWVTKGQLIGKAAWNGDPDPAAVAQARLTLNQAQMAVDNAEDQQALAGPSLAPKPDPSEIEHAKERNDRLYRLKLETDIQHEETLAALQQPGSDKGSAANIDLRDARQRLRRAQTALNDLTNPTRIVPVLAPADGLLVLRDADRGAFEVVTGLQHLEVEALVSDSPQLGQPATILCNGAPLQATVKTIGNPQPTPTGATAYPITLAVENPNGLRPQQMEVEIVLDSAAN